MGLEQVKKEIIDHAQDEAMQILAAAKDQVKKELDAAHSVVDAFEAEVDAALKKELDALEKKYYAGMHLLSKKILLQKRKELLEQLFQEFNTDLAQMHKAEKTKILHTLIARAKKDCTLGKIYCSPRDVSLVATQFPVVQQKPIIGGIIAESKDRYYCFDYSFDTTLALLQERKLQEVYALLF